MHLDNAVRDCRIFVKQWGSTGQSIGYLVQYSKKLSTSTSNLFEALQQAWSLHNSNRPPDFLLRQLQRYAWLPTLCEAVMSLKDCCSTQQHAGISPGQIVETTLHADTAILAVGSLVLAILRWCNLSQLLHTAQQQGAPRGAAVFRELFEQVWCHAGVFLLANYAAVLVAILGQEVQQLHHLAQQESKSPAQQEKHPRASPKLQLQQRSRAVQLSQLEQSEHYLQSDTAQQQVMLQQECWHLRDRSPAKAAQRRSNSLLYQADLLSQLPRLATASVWRNVQLPAVHSVWCPPSDLHMWRSHGFGVFNSAAAELQLLLMLWGWAIRVAPTIQLQHYASVDVLLLLLEAAWLLEVCPAASSHQKRGLCLWNTPAHMLRQVVQPVLPPDSADGDAAVESSAADAEAQLQCSHCEEGQANLIKEHLFQKSLLEARIGLLQTEKASAKQQHSVLEAKAMADRCRANADETHIAEQFKQQADASMKDMYTLLVKQAQQVHEVLDMAALHPHLVRPAEMQQLQQHVQEVVAHADEMQLDQHKLEALSIEAMKKKADTLCMLLGQRDELQQQQADVLRILQHSMAGGLVQLPLQLLQHLQPLTDAQLKQAAVQFSRLDDTIRKLVELPTLLLQAEQGILYAQQARLHGSLEKPEQSPSCEGFWYEHTLPLLQLAEVYIRCQHLSRVVGLEAGQLLAAVVPRTAKQLLHVLSNKQSVAAIAALAITRCKALKVLLVETLAQQQAADGDAAADAAPASSAAPAAAVAGAPASSTAQQEAQDLDVDSSGSGSIGSSSFEGCHERQDSHSNDAEGSSSDDDNVSISSWCSSSSSILDSPGVLLHEKHLAVGSMALHMMDQAVAWLRIVYLWQTYPAARKCNCQLSAADIADKLDEACAYEPAKGTTWQQSKGWIAPPHHRHFAALMSDNDNSSSSTSPVTTRSSGEYAADGTAAGASIGAAGDISNGADVIYALAATILPLACCMIQHAACALDQLLPVWKQISPPEETGKAGNAAAAAEAAGESEQHISSSSSSSVSSSECLTGSESDSGSSCEDDALPSLKDIASFHQSMAAKSIWSAAWAAFAVQPSIATVLHQQDQQIPGRGQQKDAFQAALASIKQLMQWNDQTDELGISCATHNALLIAMLKHQACVPDAKDTAALRFLAMLPFSFSNVLQASAAVSLPAPAVSSRSQQASTQGDSAVAGINNRSWGCHNAECVNLSGVTELAMHTKSCSGCKTASYACTYCGGACQQADWPVHRHACKSRRRSGIQ